MKVWTEDLIRQCLDGTFTRVHYDGRVTVENVSPDYLPPFAGGPQRVRGKNVNPRTYWAPQEDELLWQMRIRNRAMAEIAWALDRTEEAVKKRVQLLRAKKGVVA